MTSKEDIKILGMPVSCCDPNRKSLAPIANRRAMPSARLAISVADSN